MGTEVSMERERLTERELQILDHLEQAQGPDVPLTEYASAYGIDVKDLSTQSRPFFSPEMT
jgi:hypothetical protein